MKTQAYHSCHNRRFSEKL